MSSEASMQRTPEQLSPTGLRASRTICLKSLSVTEQAVTHSQQSCQNFPLLSILMYILLVSFMTVHTDTFNPFYPFFNTMKTNCGSTFPSWNNVNIQDLGKTDTVWRTVNILIKARPVTWLCIEASGFFLITLLTGFVVQGKILIYIISLYWRIDTLWWHT